MPDTEVDAPLATTGIAGDPQFTAADAPGPANPAPIPVQEGDALATTLGRIDAATAGIPDQVIRDGIKKAFLAVLTTPDAHEVVVTATDPDTGEVTTTTQPPVHVDPDTGVETPLVSRDETQDSIDPATGTLTDDAVAKRRAIEKALADDSSELARDNADLAEIDKQRAAKLGEIDTDTALVKADQDALAVVINAADDSKPTTIVTQDPVSGDVLTTEVVSGPVPSAPGDVTVDPATGEPSAVDPATVLGDTVEAPGDHPDVASLVADPDVATQVVAVDEAPQPVGELPQKELLPDVGATLPGGDAMALANPEDPRSLEQSPDGVTTTSTLEGGA